MALNTDIDTQQLSEFDVIVPSYQDIKKNYHEKEKLRPLMYQWFRSMVMHQARLAHDISFAYPELAFPEQTNSEFYRKYFQAVGEGENNQTIDMRQLRQRVISHPGYNEKISLPGVLRTTFIGCASGINNIEAALIKDIQKKRPRGKTIYVGIEPYPPETHNPLINPFYSVRLEDIAGNPIEQNQSDIATLFGSSRMDIPKIIDRLDSTLALNSILKKGGIAIIDEAVPPSALPNLGNQSLKDIISYSLESDFAQAAGAHDLDAPGFFYRSWVDKDGQEFGKKFYAEPLEQYFFVMGEFGFEPLLADYDQITTILKNPEFLKPWSRAKQTLSQYLPPSRENLADQLFYQSTEGAWRKHLRYVLFWVKTGDPNPEILKLMQELHGKSLFSGVVK